MAAAPRLPKQLCVPAGTTAVKQQQQQKQTLQPHVKWQQLRPLGAQEAGRTRQPAAQCYGTPAIAGCSRAMLGVTGALQSRDLCACDMQQHTSCSQSCCWPVSHTSEGL